MPNSATTQQAVAHATARAAHAAFHQTVQQAHVIRSALLLALGGALVLLAVGRLRAYKLKERYAIVFLLLALPFIVLAVFPKSIEWLSSALGISYFTVMLLCVSAFLFLVVFELLSIVSQQDRKITTLAQMVGILNQRQAEQEREMRALREREDVSGVK